MKKYEQSELKLNEYAVPTNFHDMSIVNMEFENDKLIIKFSLAEYLDDFNILEDDKHHAILQVVYESHGNIISINQDSPIDGTAHITISIDVSELDSSIEILRQNIEKIDGIKSVDIMGVE